jgi:hypothetical protein
MKKLNGPRCTQSPPMVEMWSPHGILLLGLSLINLIVISIGESLCAIQK